MWFRSEFDKLLMFFLVLAFCGAALIGNDKLTAFALLSAGNAMGCLLTLVVGKRGKPEDAPDPTSSVTTTNSTTESKTVTPPPATPQLP